MITNAVDCMLFRVKIALTLTDNHFVVEIDLPDETNKYSLVL